MWSSVPARIVLTLVALVALVAGCGSDSGAGGDPPDSVSVTAYFPDSQGALVAEERIVAGDAEVLRAPLDILAAGPADPDLLPALPAGTRVLDVRVEGEVVVVDLSPEFESGYPPGGAAAEQAVLGPLVRTATDAAGVPAALITVEGRVPSPVGTQFDFSLPLTPGDIGI